MAVLTATTVARDASGSLRAADSQKTRGHLAGRDGGAVVVELGPANGPHRGSDGHSR